jgi:SH3-like domain-containing protein
VRKLLSVLFIVFFLLLTACASAPAATPTPIPPTNTLLPSSTPTVTALPTVTPTATFTPTETPFIPFEAEINTENVNLRAGPGYLFPVLRIYHEGDPVTVLGKAPGGEWFRVRMKEDVEGWIILWLLNANGHLSEAPIVEPQDVLLIRGRLHDRKGTPMRGIVFTVTRSKDQTTSSNNALTNADGEFFSYMPFNATGNWVVYNSGISCNSNVWKDESCTSYKAYYQGIVEPESITISLPSTEVLEFTWN